MNTKRSPIRPPRDPRTLTSDLDKALAILYISKLRGTSWLSAAEISKILANDYGLPLHWRTIDTLLRKDRNLAQRRKRKGVWQFEIMQKGEAELGQSSAPIFLVDPERAVQATISLHGFLAKLAGTVRVCDPYLDNATLEHLDACSSTTQIRLLTQNVRDSGPLRRVYAAGKTQGRALEIRVAQTARLHDRYVIDDAGMLILGTSLNGFGKKQSFVIQVGQDIRGVMVSTFDHIWQSSRPWP